MFRLSHDGISHLDLALTHDTAGDRNTLLGRMVCDIVRALVHISSAIVLVPAAWVFVAFLAEVGVCTASELGKIAAEVALELNVAQAVLLAHELLADAHVRQPAALAHKLLLSHILFILLVHVLRKLLVLTIDVAAEEWVVAARAFVELADMEGILDGLFVESVCGVLKPLLALQHVVLLHLLESILAKSALEDAHFGEFLPDFGNCVMTVHILLASGALHEIEGDSLRAPTMAEQLSDAVGVENVAAVELQAGLLAQCAAADGAWVKLSEFVGGSARRFEAGKVVGFALTFAATASVTAIMFMLAGANLGKRLEFGHSAGLGIHHGEEGGLCLSVDEVLLGASTIDTNKVSEFNHLLYLKLVCR